MMESLASALPGGQFSAEVDLSHHPGAETPNTDKLMIVVDTERGAPTAVAASVRYLIGYLRAAGRERFPGERRYARRRVCEEQGVLINVTQLEQLRSLTWHGRGTRLALFLPHGGVAHEHIR